MDKAALISHLIRKRKQERKLKRRFWVHPMLQKRKEFGEFYHLVQEIKEDEEKFFNYFRMDLSAYNQIVEKLINYRDA